MPFGSAGRRGTHLLCAHRQSPLWSIKDHQVHNSRQHEGCVHGRMLPLIDVVHYETTIVSIKCPAVICQKSADVADVS